ILKAFAYLPNPDTETHASLRKGVSFLMSWIGADGKIRSDGAGLLFPVYTAALASMVVDLESQDPVHERARSVWFHHLLQYRLSDPPRNKAGVAGTDRPGRVRYNSYGSATADGLRALIRCGLAPDHPRVEAARRWLESHFSATSNPGRFTEDREVLRDATYY